ncbi:hypothetical protein [Anaerotignum lactatifermentans]|uniref:hypothetical protein n=1 Tax=Anaerotignum lactatifermentans TaxID=160404 RepID=UPI003AB47DF1
MEKNNLKPLILCAVFLVIAVIGCTFWTKWQNRPLLGNTDEEICETIDRVGRGRKAEIDLKHVEDGEVDGTVYRCVVYESRENEDYPQLVMFRQDADGNFLWYEGDIFSGHSIYRMPSPPDTQVYEYVFPIEGTDYHFFYVTGEDVAYLTDEAGNVYSVGEERPAFLTFLPYWDNLDTEYLDAQGNPLW